MGDKIPTLKSRFKGFILKIVIGVLVLTCLAIWTCSWTYSSGIRAGQLIKFSKKGIFFKTHEGELNLGGLRMGESNDGLRGNLWEFSVLDTDVLNKLEDAEGKRVKLSYKERFKAMPWQGDTNYFVTDVEIINSQ